jgi:hypothetical protein
MHDALVSLLPAGVLAWRRIAGAPMVTHGPAEVYS